MRLQMVVSEMAVGGAERVVVDLLRGAADRGDEAGLLAGAGPLDGELSGLSLYRAPLPTGRTAGALLRSTVASASFARRFRPHLIHAHNVRVTGLARIGSQIARPIGRPPLIATYHGVPHAEIANAARVLRVADMVVCVSRGLSDQLEAGGVPTRRLEVIPNGVPAATPLSPERRARIDAEFGLAEGAPVVAIVGRLAPQKAHDRFLRASALVRGRIPAAQFLVVGDGSLRDSLEQAARQAGIGDAVRFTGVRDDARELIARSDLLVFSSTWEGLSIAALEALAAGTPVVSTDVAGTRELLASGAGIVVPHDDEALAAAVVELLEDPARQVRMGAEGQALHARRFSTERMVESYREVYARLLKR